MLITVQFPLADSRYLLEKTGRTRKPNWPDVTPDRDFVPGFGLVRVRKRGGLPGWIGEGLYCDASNAIKFQKGAPLPFSFHVKTRNREMWGTWDIGVAFRRLYFDGLVVGKIEIGFSIRSCFEVEIFRPLLAHVLSTKVCILFGDSRKPIPLIQAAKALADSFLRATTSARARECARPLTWWVTAGSPLVLWEYTSEERVHMPFYVKNITSSVYDEFSKLDFYNFTDGSGRTLPLWLLGLDKHLTRRNEARAIRISLLRLHAELECLRVILNNVATDRIKIESRGNRSDVLQRYLNQATKRIQGLERVADDSAHADVSSIARSAVQFIRPAEISGMLNSLKTLDIRKNIFKKVEKHLEQQITIQNLAMRDINIVGQGAAGEGAKVEHASFVQIWNQNASALDVVKLAEELGRLREAMLKNAREPENYIDVGTVASAETEAKKGNGAKALEFLSKAGKWVLDTAKEVGVNIAAEAIMKASGMK